MISSRDLISAPRAKFAVFPALQLKKDPVRGSCMNHGYGVHMEGDFNILNKINKVCNQNCWGKREIYEHQTGWRQTQDNAPVAAGKTTCSSRSGTSPPAAF